MLSDQPDKAACKKIISDIVHFENLSAINLISEKRFDDISASFSFDIIEWEKAGFSDNFWEFYSDSPVTYLFHVPSIQRQFLENSLKIYSGSSVNHKLRKMLEK